MIRDVVLGFIMIDTQLPTCPRVPYSRIAKGRFRKGMRVRRNRVADVRPHPPQSGLPSSSIASHRLWLGKRRPHVGRLSTYIGKRRPHGGKPCPIVAKLGTHLADLCTHVGKLRTYIGKLGPHVGKLGTGIGKLRPHVGKLGTYMGKLRPHIEFSFPDLVFSFPDIGFLFSDLGLSQPDPANSLIPRGL